MSFSSDRRQLAIFVYNRPDKTKVLLDKIKEFKINRFNVFSDGPKVNESDEPVKEIRKMIKKIDWADVSVFEQSVNLGLANSVISGVDKVFRSGFDEIIVLEDDCIPHSTFFPFMELALDRYKESLNVMHLSGFGLPLIQKNIDDGYFTPYPCSWGWATWKNRWENCNFNDLSNYKRILSDQYLRKEFDRPGAAFSEFLEKQLGGKIDSWLIRWYVHIFLKNGICLWAKNSHLVNRGFDGQGVHKVKFDRFNQNYKYRSIKIYFTLPSPKEVSPQVMNEFRRYFMGSKLLERLKTLIYLVVKKVYLFFSRS